MPATDPLERSWLVLVHQLPPKPPRVRVRIWRRLQALGALQLKSSVYLLPDGAEALEDFEWLLQEIEAAGADATLLRSTLLAGLGDVECVERFRAAAAAEYAALAAELGRLGGRRGRARTRAASPEASAELGRQLDRAAERLAAIEARDFFGAEGHEVVTARIEELRGRTEESMATTKSKSAEAKLGALRGRTWVTRTGVKIDRTASAWLIRRFVDPEATFRFVADRRHAPEPGELRFDMTGGEFGHEGAACTFETLIARLGLTTPGLGKLAQIVHDLDLKEVRYGHPETAGVAALIGGLVATTPEDLDRIERAMPLYDGLLASFAGQR